jgi:hypothetical protein
VTTSIEYIEARWMTLRARLKLCCRVSAITAILAPFAVVALAKVPGVSLALVVMHVVMSIISAFCCGLAFGVQWLIDDKMRREGRLVE